MTVTFTGNDKLGDIVNQFPGASNLFKEYRIDFCCGGNRTLSAALQQQNLDEREIVSKLNQLYEEAESRKSKNLDWLKASYSELISHVVDTHHVYLQKELPLLSEYVTKILRVHGELHPELAKLHKLFHTLKMELEQHLIKEEESVFPSIKEYEKHGSQDALSRAVAAIKELEEEHTGAGDLLREMREVTNDYTLPEEACRTYTLTFHKLQELESDMFQHVHLENNILFPRLLKEKGE